MLKKFNLIVARSYYCKYERNFKRARRLYVFLNRKKLYENPELIIKMAEHGILRGLWSPISETQARVSIMSTLHKIEHSIVSLSNPTRNWNKWAENSPWSLPEGLPK